jgi:epoxyqueuosine reductase
MDKQRSTLLIKQEAARLGFSFCGISEARFLVEEAPRLENWLNQNMHGQMGYMVNHFDMRLDPTLLVPGAKSVVSLMLNYYPEEHQPEGIPKISKYAYGEDYHKVIKRKLKEFINTLKERIGDVNGRAFVDSAPVLDRAWAKNSGLGWIGKNGNLINKGAGSFFFLAELIIDLELEYDGPVKDYCGSCTRCIDACPTGAIVEPMVVDGSRCISYYTIELRDAIPNSEKGKFDNWAFGCDICQDVCPWNRFSKPTTIAEFSPNAEGLNMTENNWEEMTEEVFGRVFTKSALKRAGFNGIKKNIKFLKKD